jgi:hypothetical protein
VAGTGLFGLHVPEGGRRRPWRLGCRGGIRRVCIGL